jgi:penicillin-binding protein 1A
MRPPPRGRLDDDLELLIARRRHNRRHRRRRGRPLLILAAVLVATGAAVAIGGAATFYTYGAGCDLAALKPVTIGQNSFIYAADGSLLGAIPAERNRQPVSLARMSRWVPRATIAIEDKRFYEHGGLDPTGIARALWADVRAGGFVQGGSTITQQLVRNLYISRERTVSRKLKEACLAVKLNHDWSKKRILQTYLNQVYYGSLAYGIEAAAQTYFSKPATALTLPEAALLAGLIKAPSAYDPFVAPSVALARRNEVLDAMLAEGMVTQAEHDWAAHRPLALRPGRLYTTVREPYFFGYVRDQLIEKYGAATVRFGGLKVYTTIQPRFQRLAEQAIRQTLNEPTDPAAAVISIDPATGAIRAMTAVIPGRRNNQFNLLSQARRQPGSTFKTFVLTTAVDKGIDPASTYYVSAPFTYRPTAKGSCETGEWWCVKTYDSTYVGWTSIERATLRSDNTVYAQLTLDVTPAAVAATARRMGVRTPLDVHGVYVPALGLGSIAVSPLDMASAYATLAAGGIYSEPMAIRRVVLANGNADTTAGWGTPQRKRVLSPGAAAVVTKILEENVQYGTGTKAGFGRPAAGKTGTTDNNADAWFVGYVPQLDTAVWVGYPSGEIPMQDVHGIAVTGGSFPAEIWHLYMANALANAPTEDFPVPAHWPTWKPFHRGPFALSYDPNASTSTTSTTTSTAPAPRTNVSAPAPRPG